MDMDNRVGIDRGSEGWAGQERVIGENWDNCNRRTIEKSFEKIIKYKINFKNLGYIILLFKLSQCRDLRRRVT